MIGASGFPRHWVYDSAGRLSQKSGLTDFRDWFRSSFGSHTPWGNEDSEALVTTVESALERRLSSQMVGENRRPRFERVTAGSVIVPEGDPGTEVFLILDGVVGVDHAGKRLAEYGPGAVLGEKAHLEGGVRTSTLVALTPCRLAVVEAGGLDRSALQTVSQRHRHEANPG
jgi:CRP-like cAMP-binding protein